MKIASTVSLLACVLISATASAQGTPRGLFCSAEGTGVWGGRPATFRYQTSLLVPGRSKQSDTVTLYVDERPAAVVRLLPGAPQSTYVGGEGLPAKAGLVVTIDEELGFTAVYSDWNNPSASARGICEWNYGG